MRSCVAPSCCQHFLAAAPALGWTARSAARSSSFPLSPALPLSRRRWLQTTASSVGVVALPATASVRGHCSATPRSNSARRHGTSSKSSADSSFKLPSALRERELFQTTPFVDAAPHLPSENADASTRETPPNDDMATTDVYCAAAVTSTGAKKSVRELMGVFEAAKQQTTIPGNAADGAQRAMKAVVFADGTAAVGDGQGTLRASARPVAKHVAKKEEEGEEEKTTTTTTNRPIKETLIDTFRSG